MFRWWHRALCLQQKQVTDIAFGAPSVAIDEKTGLYRSEFLHRFESVVKVLNLQLHGAHTHNPVFFGRLFCISS